MPDTKSEVSGDALVKTEPEDVPVESSGLSPKKENGCGDKTSDPNIKKEKDVVEDSTERVTKTAEENNDPDLEFKLVRQMEYYFGDINLPQDKYLQEQIKLDDGWVPLETMLRFKRLKALSSKPETIVAALQSSSTLMEISEDKTKLRRLPSKPLPDLSAEYLKEQLERTVYCKGFPASLDDIDAVQMFFTAYGEVDNIVLRRYKDSKASGRYVFKGSVYVLFKTKELADKFLSLESVKYEDKELIRMTKTAHVEEQKRERDERWGKKVKPRTGEEDIIKKRIPFPKGCLFKLSPIENESTARDSIKEAVVAHGVDVAFIQYDKGDTEAIVRLHSSEDGAAVKLIKALEDSNKRIEIDNEINVKPTLLEGEEEEAFLERTRQALERNSHKGPGSRGRNKGGRGNYRGKHNRKRFGGPMSDGATPAKKAAV